MSSKGCVLAVLDPTTDRQPGLARAARLAEHLGQPLEVFVAQYDQFVAQDDKAKSSLMEHTRQATEELAQGVTSVDQAVSVDVRWDRPVDEAVLRKAEDSGVSELVACAETYAADIVITGAISRNALERMLIGQTAERLLDRLPCDLLVVKPDVRI